jgi:hypothetical protein
MRGRLTVHWTYSTVYSSMLNLPAHLDVFKKRCLPFLRTNILNPFIDKLIIAHLVKNSPPLMEAGSPLLCLQPPPELTRTVESPPL